jgi:hypothetical protein
VHAASTDSPAPAASPAAVQRHAAEPDFTASEAMRTLFYWLLILATGLRNAVHSRMSFLMALVIVWFLQSGGRGADDNLPMAAFFMGILSLGTFVFTPIVRWLGDRTSKPQLSAVYMAFGAVSMAMFLH